MQRSLVVLALIFLLIALTILAPMVPQFGHGLIYPAHAQYSDLTITHWPAFAYTRDQLQATGQIPLWRTSILSGTPFAADPLSGLFYPLHWFAFTPFVPLSLAFNLLMLLHFTLAAATMYYLMRRWSVGRAGALIAAFAYAASPKIVAHMGVGHVTLVEAWAWVPLVIAGLTPQPPLLKPSFDSAPLRSGCGFQERGSGALLSGVALAMCVLADARMAVYALVLAGLYVLITRAQRNVRTWATVMGVLLVVGVVALALAAAAWLPALTLTDGTARAKLAPQEAGTLSLDAAYLLGTLIADRSGAAERTTYVGLVVLVLAVVGVKLMWSTRRRLMIWFLIVIVSGVIAALGTNTPVYNLLYQLPGSTLFRVPARAWFLVSFALAALAGFGVQGLIDWAGRAQRRSSLLATAIILFALLFGLLGAVATRSISFLSIAILVPLTVIVIALRVRVRGRLTPDRFVVAIAVLVVIDLLAVDWALYRPIGAAEAFSDGSEPAAWLTQQPGSFRVYSPSYSIPQHVGQLFQLQLADGIDPLQLQRYVLFMQQASGVGAWNYSVTLPAFSGAQKDEDIRTALKDIQPNATLLGLLNVKYIAAAFPIAQPDLSERVVFSTTQVYENARVLPRAFLVNKIDVAPSPEAASAWLTAHDVSTAAVVEGLPLPIQWPVPPGKVNLYDQSADHLALRATGPGWLVLSEVIAPDWVATIDGELVDILPTDLTLRGVYVPWGDHTITFDYQPRQVYAGVLISVLSALAVVAAVLMKRVVKRDNE